MQNSRNNQVKANKLFILKRNTIIELLVHLLVFFVYLWIASHGYLTFDYSKTPISKTHYQSEAFLNGQLYLKIRPKPELLALQNPYDGRYNEHLRLHDASLYNGKYYLYFSPIVAFFITSPLKLLTGYYISDALICTLLCFIGYLFSYKILAYTLSSAQLNLPLLYKTGMQLALGLTITQLYSLNRIKIYEVAIFSGYAFLMMGLYYYMLIMTSTITKKIYIILSGIFLAFTVWARPSNFIIVFILSLLFLVYQFFPQRREYKLHKIFLFFSPLFIIGFVIAWYNYIRFGSITEFGLTYQLTVGFNYTKGEILTDIFGMHNFFANMVNYFFRDLQFVPFFPYFINCTQFYVPPELANRYDVECQSGILRIPIFSLILFCIPLCKCYYTKYRQQTLFAFLILICSLLSFLAVSVAPMSGMRYMIDFLPSFSIAMFILFSLSLACNKHADQHFDILSLYFCFAVFISLLINFLLCFPGYEYAFINANPHLYRTIEHFLNF